ncbi:uncharacterized protein LOC133795188 [Humulus lupulus]|uniref:uncharacterized protein LOC133795188 n=1 Tax=Humulus lupulus TaxID=3486 RepID=UPI002B412398|nr:uncharacterized protein LOC133795188 [Humulus lupulus]
MDEPSRESSRMLHENAVIQSLHTRPKIIPKNSINYKSEDETPELTPFLTGSFVHRDLPQAYKSQLGDDGGGGTTSRHGIEEGNSQNRIQSYDIGEDNTQNVEPNRVTDQHVLQFLDSTDDYLTKMDSLYMILRQGWFELASARHSMGASRVSSAMLDLNSHSAATSVQVSEDDVDTDDRKAHFALRKWVSSDNVKQGFGEAKLREDSLQLRHRSLSPFSELTEKASAQNGAPLIVDDQIQKERSKSLSVFGTLVSPKLRTAQLSFETALEKLVEIANARSTMLSTFDQVKKKLEET